MNDETTSRWDLTPYGGFWGKGSVEVAEISANQELYNGKYEQLSEQFTLFINAMNTKSVELSAESAERNDDNCHSLFNLLQPMWQNLEDFKVWCQENSFSREVYWDFMRELDSVCANFALIYQKQERMHEATMCALFIEDLGYHPSINDVLLNDRTITKSQKAVLTCVETWEEKWEEKYQANMASDAASCAP